ncbi:MHJ_0274 family protein [Mycoplasma nasistruthionis]|uniref:DUF4381 domain-containing protein n=1 Tax=Mycoplasma nasistruthionis TaxID=353852 RepID=A0A4Y6I6P5_9MOLU|nr:DUF4381 domain-containing protein [Mycoplasma nasistruthionis]QCZ36620.1 DUF4381 domain-containing protein [Mycoplasma nasistruthionis]QDF64917.1 DUF4381 domain-containing protein [Mycoplasma nasistruthionis]
MDSTSIIMWIIFGVIILGFTAWILYQWLKDKRNQKKAKQVAFQLSQEAAVHVYDLTIMINELVELNKVTLSEFVPSIGQYKMSEINNAARVCLNEMLKSGDYREYLHENKKYAEFVSNLRALKDCNANIWDTKASQVLTFFKNHLEASKKDLEQYAATTVDNLFKDPESLKNIIKEKYEKALNEQQN